MKKNDWDQIIRSALGAADYRFGDGSRMLGDAGLARICNAVAEDVLSRVEEGIVLLRSQFTGGISDRFDTVSGALGETRQHFDSVLSLIESIRANEKDPGRNLRRANDVV